MSRKSTAITLGVLGAVAAAGLSACCCSGFLTPQDKEGAIAQDKEKKGEGGQGSRHVTHRSPRLFPFFLGGGGGGVSHPTGPSGHPTGGTSSGSSRGGFGSTASHGAGGVGA